MQRPGDDVHVTLPCRLVLPLTVEGVPTRESVLPDTISVAAVEAVLHGPALPGATIGRATS